MDYIKEAMRTDGSTYGAKERLQSEKIVRCLHGAIGIATEAGELLDVLIAILIGCVVLFLENIGCL